MNNSTITGSKLKKPASAVISITPDSAKIEPNISKPHKFPELLISYAFFLLVFITFITTIVKSFDRSPMVCKIFKEQFANDTSREINFALDICKNQDMTQSIIDDAMIFFHLILTFISCVCCVLAQSKFGFGISIFNIVVNGLVLRLYSIGFVAEFVTDMGVFLQFVCAFMTVFTSFIFFADSDIAAMQLRKTHIRRNPETILKK